MSKSVGAETITASQAADLIRDELRAADEGMAVRMATEAISRLLGLATNAEFIAATRPPASTGDSRWDTLLATSVAWAAHERKLVAPKWTDKPPLEREWLWGRVGEPTPEWARIVRADTPPEFLAKRILIRRKSLAAR